MEQQYAKERQYLKAKKRVDQLKGYYIHLIVYVLVNILLSSIIIYGLMESGYRFKSAISHFGVYSTWLFWGIGMFFHTIGVFGTQSFLGKDWEEKKLKELMEKDNTHKINP